MVRFISSLPGSDLRNEKIGSGFLNKILNNLPLELYAPGYSFLDPRTKLGKTLARGDMGISSLEDAAKTIIFYIEIGRR